MSERRPYTPPEQRTPFSRVAEGAKEMVKGAVEAIGMAVQGFLAFFRSNGESHSKKKHG